jgi:hypothetical protein
MVPSTDPVELGVLDVLSDRQAPSTTEHASRQAGSARPRDVTA